MIVCIGHDVVDKARLMMLNADGWLLTADG